MTEHKATPLLIALALLSLTLIGGAALGGLREDTGPTTREERKLTIDPDLLQARAAILYDPTTREILFDKHAELQLPLASLAKLAAATVALRRGQGEVVI